MSFKTNKKIILIGGVLLISIIGIGFMITISGKPAASPKMQSAGSETTASTNEKEPFSLQELLSQASVRRGHMMAHTCNDCHTFDEDGPHRFGPNLFGIFGARHAFKKDFAYSDALKAKHDKLWTEENLDAWLKNPKAYAPGTKMGYPGVSSAKDRADIIVYLRTLKAE